MPQPLSELEQALAAGYVLGDLSSEEIDQVEQLLQVNPDFQQEIRAMQLSFNLLPQALPKLSPPPQLREKVLVANAIATNAAALPVNGPNSRPQSQDSPRKISWSRLLAGIAALIALFLGIDNFQLRQQLSSARDVSPEGVDSEGVDIKQVAEILQRPKSRLVTLTGTGASPAAGTLLFTAGQWQEVIVSLGNLPPLSPDQVYRMWLTLENGQVIFCGEFNTNAEGSVFLELRPPETPPKGIKAKGLFVTVNPENAPLEPVGEQVMVGEI
ncbi:MAG: anti-sigma factor domain-containing protein [Microcoleaceae cyanobacterium]